MAEFYTHITVFLSIVVALGMAELISAWGDLLRHRKQTQFYWLHAYWSLVVVFLMVQFWWGLWNFRSMDAWTMTTLIALVGQTILLVLAAQMQSPKVDLSKPMDMRAYFFEHARVFFLIGVALLFILGFNDIVFLGLPLLDPENLVRAAGIAICCVAAFQTSQLFHGLLAATSAVLLVAFTMVSFTPG